MRGPTSRSFRHLFTQLRLSSKARMIEVCRASVSLDSKKIRLPITATQRMLIVRERKAKGPLHPMHELINWPLLVGARVCGCLKACGRPLAVS